jgi:RNA polymerase sigma-70 factor (ECF subfamily)
MEQSFLQMVNDNRALIFKVCNIYCSDPENRRDLFQEIVLQLWKSFPNFRQAASTGTWMYRIALNTAISNFRKELRKPESISLALHDFDIPDMTGVTDEKEQRTILHLTIDQLTPVEKAIIMLYLEEKSYEEISEIIGISTGNVGVRLNRIKNKLSKLVKTF